MSFLIPQIPFVWVIPGRLKTKEEVHEITIEVPKNEYKDREKQDEKVQQVAKEAIDHPEERKVDTEPTKPEYPLDDPRRVFEEFGL